MDEQSPRLPTNEPSTRAKPAPGPVPIPGSDLALGVGILWGSEIVADVVLAVSTGGDPEDIAPLALLARSIATALITVLVTWIFVCRRRGQSFPSGFAITRLRRSAWIWSVGLGAAGAIGGHALFSLFSTGESFMSRFTETTEGLAVISMLALLLAPVEELYYRGFIFPVLERKMGGAAAVAVVAVWFTVPHAFQLAGDWVGLPVIFGMGLLWTVQRCRSDSLTPSIVSHLTYNSVLVIAAWLGA